MTRTRAVIASLVLAGGLTTGMASVSAGAKVEHGPRSQCTAVADVLSDGPTSGADPVGYAEAQILPLRQLRLSDPGLKKAVDKLDSAYKAYSDSNGATKTAAKVSLAEKRLNAICPKAAP